MKTPPTKIRGPMVRSNSATKEGVIAVLFLFVVGFIFAAISLSMQTGQVIERRVATDQAADSASYAFASKSAQGLNFIAANNLAIAGSSHMAGVLHIAADWAIILKAILSAKSLIGGGAKFNEGDYQAVYDWFIPIAQLYLRSATGLTNLNGVIRTTFPYLGLIDAISTGASNAPSAVIIPFGAPSADEKPPADAGSGSFMSRVKDRLKTRLKELLPNYRGLRRMNSDETFCLAYRAGQLGNPGDDYHEVSPWLGPQMMPDDLSELGSVLNAAGKVVDVLGILGGFVSLRVGYAGCGFGESGKVRGGKDDYSKMLIASLFKTVLLGPLSGRTVEINSPEGSPLVIPATTSADALADELDLKYADICRTAGNKWKISNENFIGKQVHTDLDPMHGMCVIQQPKLRKHLSSTSNLTVGTDITANEKPDAQHFFMHDYSVACIGTILFKWQGFSGLKGQGKPDEHGNGVTYVKSDFSHPNVDGADVDSDLCPSFIANDRMGTAQDEYRYPPLSIPQRLFGTTDTTLGLQGDETQTPKYVNLSRGRSFISPLLDNLMPNDTQKAPRVWRGPDPRPGAFAEANEFLACAAGNAIACDFPGENGEGGYYQNKTGAIFRPSMTKLNWLCPISQKGDSSGTIIKANLKFDNPTDPGRWAHTATFKTNPNGLTSIVDYKSKYIEVQSWHNQRVDDLVAKMGCDEYEKFKSADRVKPKNKRSQSGSSKSHNYCADDGHMCWQAGMQQELGDTLAKGNLSFLVPDIDLSLPLRTAAPKETILEKSLHYAVLTINPIRTDNKADIAGRNDGTPLAHCPAGMDVEAQLDNETVRICDIQPVVGFISRVVKGPENQQIELQGSDNFGGSDVNLASGGAINAINGDTIGASGFLAISQASVKYENIIDKIEPSRTPPEAQEENAPVTFSRSKNYQMFWPSWKPVIEPSRVMSRLIPDPISRLVED